MKDEKGRKSDVLSILMVTTEWPTVENPSHAPFIVQQVESLRKLGVEVEVFYFRGASSIVNYFKAFWELRKISSCKKFDIIHAQFGQSGIPLFLSNLPLVVTFRGSDLQGIADQKGKYTTKGKILAFASRLVAKKATSIIVVAESLSRFLPPNKPYNVIPTGINLQLFKPMSRIACRRQLGLDENKFYILFAGNPSRTEKRYPLAVKSVALLNRTLQADLFYAENVPIAKMPLYINAANVLLLTSIHEGSPNVVKEALACNVPVVSVNVGDVKERMKSIQGCYICSENPEDIAESLRMTLANPVPNFESRKFVESLDENKVVSRIIDVYRSIL